MVETSTSFQSSWTLAQSIIFDIAGHLGAGRRFWLAGNLEKYYWEFESIVRTLHGMLEDREKKLAEIKEEEIVKYFPALIQKKEDKVMLIKLLKEYDGMVMDFLHKHKLDVPQRKDRKKLIA